METETEPEEPLTEQRSNPNCEMPECGGTPEDDTHAVRDPDENLMEMCDGCLNDGWRSVVEVLD